MIWFLVVPPTSYNWVLIVLKDGKGAKGGGSKPCCEDSVVWTQTWENAKNERNGNNIFQEPQFIIKAKLWFLILDLRHKHDKLLNKEAWFVFNVKCVIKLKLKLTVDILGGYVQEGY